MKTIEKNKKTIKSLLLSLIVIVLITGAYFIAAYSNKFWPFVANVTPSQSTQTNDIDYSPPTEQEKDSSQDGKKSSGDTPTPTQDNITVDVSYAGPNNDGTAIEVRAFTTDVIEGTGTCTATLTLGSLTVTGTSKGFVDARSTICEPIEISKNQFKQSGGWKLVVTYTSPTRTGVSTETSVNVDI